MLETIKNLSIIFALNVASVSTLHLMIKAARLKRKQKRDAELKAVRAEAYNDAKRDLEQKQAQEREEYKRSYRMLEPNTEQVYGNVIQLPYRG